MVQAGILAEDEPLELIEGELVQGTPQGPLHAKVIRQLGSRLTRPYAHYSVSQGARYRLVRVLAGNDTVTPPGTSAAWTVDELLP